MKLYKIYIKGTIADNIIINVLLLYHLHWGIGLYNFKIFFYRIVSTDLILAVIPPKIVNGIINNSQIINTKSKVEIGIAFVDFI